MAAPKLKENTRPQITYNEPYKAAKRLSNCLCGIILIILGIVSAKLTEDGTAAVMLFVMGLAAFLGE